MPKRTSETTHVTTDSLFEDLGFSAEEAAVLEVKLVLHREIMKVIEKKRLNTRQLVELLGVPQPKISDLTTGKVAGMTVDKLTKYLHRLGREVRVTTRRNMALQISNELGASGSGTQK